MADYNNLKYILKCRDLIDNVWKIAINWIEWNGRLLNWGGIQQSNSKKERKQKINKKQKYVMRWRIDGGKELEFQYFGEKWH